jgi:hypothetical protein
MSTKGETLILTLRVSFVAWTAVVPVWKLSQSHPFPLHMLTRDFGVNVGVASGLGGPKLSVGWTATV